MKIANETKVGILAVFAIVLLVLGYQYLQGKRLFSSSMLYHAEYDRISGLGTSDDVIFRGLTIGQITNIKLASAKDVIIVSFTIEEDIDIPVGSEARIVSADLLGDKALEIILHDSMPIIKDGGYLRGTLEQSLTAQIEEQLAPVKRKIEVLLGSIDSVITSIQGIFDIGLQDRIDENVGSIEMAINNIQEITASINQLVSAQVENTDIIMSNLAAITTTIKNNRDALDRTFKNMESITDTLAKANVAQTITNLNSLIAKLDEASTKMTEGDGTMAQMLNNEELYLQIEKSARNLNQLLEEIRKNPGSFAPALIRIGVK